MERIKKFNAIRYSLQELRTLGATLKENFSALTAAFDDEKFAEFERLNAARITLISLIEEENFCRKLYEEVLTEPPPDSFAEVERLLNAEEVRIMETSVYGRAKKFLQLVTDNPEYQKILTRHKKKLQVLFAKKVFDAKAESTADPYAKFIDAMNAPSTGTKILAIQELMDSFDVNFIGAGLFDGELVFQSDEPVAKAEPVEEIPDEPEESHFAKALRESNALLADDDFAPWEKNFAVDKKDRDKEFSAKRFRLEFSDTGSLQPLLLMAASRGCVAYSVTPPKKFTPDTFENAAQSLLKRGYLQKFSFGDFGSFYGMTKKFADFVRGDNGKKFINSITKGHKGFVAAGFVEEDARAALTRAIYFRLHEYEHESDKSFVTADFYPQAFRGKFYIGDERGLIIGCFWNDLDDCDKFLKKLRQYLNETTRAFDRVAVAGLTLAHAERVYAALKTVMAEDIPPYVDVYFYSVADNTFYTEDTQDELSPEEFFAPVEDDFDDDDFDNEVADESSDDAAPVEEEPEIVSPPADEPAIKKLDDTEPPPADDITDAETGNEISPVVRKMLLDKKFYCATAYMKAQTLQNADVVPLYRRLAFALNDPLLDAVYSSDEIFSLIDADINAFDESLVIAAALRAFFYNRTEYDYIIPNLYDDIKKFDILRGNVELAQVLRDVKTFKLDNKKGADYFTGHRTKDAQAVKNRLNAVMREANEYYRLVFEGDFHGEQITFTKTRKLLFDTDSEFCKIFVMIKTPTDGIDDATLTAVKEFLNDKFLRKNGAIDKEKLQSWIESCWEKAKDPSRSDDIVGAWRKTLINKLEQAAEIIGAWLECVESLSGDEINQHEKFFAELLTEVEAARKSLAKQLKGKELTAAGCLVLDKTLKEIADRLKGAFNPLDGKYFYVQFLCGDKVILDKDYLPRFDLNISDGTANGLPEQIRRHAMSKLPTIETRIEQIFEAGGDDFGSAQLLDDYLKATSGKSVIAAKNYDLKKCVSSAAKDAPRGRESFIGGLELAQSYGQFDMMPEGTKEKILQLVENCYEYALQSDNYGVFFRVKKHWEDVLDQNAAENAETLKQELYTTIETYRQTAPDVDAEELNAAVAEIEQIIESRNFTVARSLIFKLSEGDLYKKFDDTETGALARFISDYSDCYNKVYDNAYSLENLLAKKIFTHDKVSRAKLNLVKSWITNPVGEDRIKTLLELLGFDVNSVQKISSSANTINFHVEVFGAGQIRYSHPIAAFGSDAEVEGFRVTCLFGRYDEKNLIDKFKELGNRKHTLVLLDWALDLPTRRRLAKEIKLDKSLTEKVFAVVDRVTIMYLLKNCAEQLGTKRITDTLMALIMPFARCQPYISSPKIPLPPEMFIGRESEINEVTNQGGVNIVCGGRQLGKSALLKMAARKIDGHNDERAIYLDILDKDYSEAALLTSRELSDKKFFAEPFETDDWENLARAIRNRLASDELPKIPYFLLMLDEADRFIETCAASNYAPIVALAKVQQDSHNGNRFKFVIAGLRNIIRFEREKILSDNNILPTLKSLTIKPFGLEDARKLLEVPLRYLGLYFPDNNKDSLILTILETANYFPSLIQLYCEKLVKALFESSYAGYNADTPVYTISENHIKKVLADKDFTEDIKTKIEITLGLGKDKYYHSIANLLAYLYYNQNNVDGYEPRDLLKAAEDYELVKKELLPASEDKVDALMQELCELNILRRTPAGKYLFSRQRILRIVGTPGEVDDALLKLATEAAHG